MLWKTEADTGPLWDRWRREVLVGVRKEQVTIQGEEVLEGILEFPDVGLEGGVVISHPHPLHGGTMLNPVAVSYTHLRAHETDSYLVCRLLLEKKKKTN